jgi:plasmid maintenance system antidote protein VapI
MFYLYGLFDPTTNDLRYIGKTYDLKMRLKGHLSKYSLQTKSHKNHWLKSLLEKGLEPTLYVLETYNTEEECYEAEETYIQYYKELGVNLTNNSDGGRGGNKGHKSSEETRKNQSIRNSGTGNPMYGKRGELAPWFGRKHTDEYLSKMRSLTMEDAETIRHLYATEKTSFAKLAEQFDTNTGTISSIIYNKYYKTDISQPVQKAPRIIEVGANGITREEAFEIRSLFKTGKYLLKDLAEQFETRIQVISNIIKNKLYKDKNNIINIKDVKNQFYVSENGVRISFNDAKDIRELFSSGKMNQKELAEKYKIASNKISNIITNKLLIDPNYTPIDKNLIPNKKPSEKRKLTDEKVIEIKKLYKTGKYSMEKLGERFEINRKSISDIINNKTYKQ